MAKQVLILSGSPRKQGNSDQLCDALMDGAKQAGHFVEKRFLRDHKIGYCTGCGVCNETAACVQKDDMADILDQMVRADIIVLSTPVYFYTMDAQMKTLIDRTVPRYTELSGKGFYFIVTAADTDRRQLERTLEGFRGFTCCLEDARELGVVYGTGAWQIGDIKNTPALEEARRMGASIS